MIFLSPFLLRDFSLQLTLKCGRNTKAMGIFQSIEAYSSVCLDLPLGMLQEYFTKTGSF